MPLTSSAHGLVAGVVEVAGDLVSLVQPLLEQRVQLREDRVPGPIDGLALRVVGLVGQHDRHRVEGEFPAGHFDLGLRLQAVDAVVDGRRIPPDVAAQQVSVQVLHPCLVRRPSRRNAGLRPRRRGPRSRRWERSGRKCCPCRCRLSARRNSRTARARSPR